MADDFESRFFDLEEPINDLVVWGRLAQRIMPEEAPAELILVIRHLSDVADDLHRRYHGEAPAAEECSVGN